MYQKYKRLENEFNADTANNLSVELVFTMMDSKAISAAILPEIYGPVSTKRCIFCLKLSHGTENFQGNRLISEIIDPRSVAFGISPLHLLINATKFLIYNVGCGTTEKDVKNKQVIDAHKRIFNYIHVDLNNTRNGFGSSITGNVCRRLLKNSEEFSKTIKVDKKTIELTLDLINLCRSTEKICIDTYNEKASILSELLNGVHLTPTLHKMIFHGGAIIQYFQKKYNCGLGIFSEEPLENFIRKFRTIRADHSRKNNVRNNNLDSIKFAWRYFTINS